MIKNFFLKSYKFSVTSVSFFLLFTALHSQWRREEVRAGVFPYGICAGDFNSDGFSDIAVSSVQLLNENVYLIINRGGTFDPPLPFLAGDGSLDITAADFDSDGFLDIAVAEKISHISVFLNTGSDSFFDCRRYYSGQDPKAICAGDFDLDGDEDIAVANYYSGTVTVFQNAGDGNFIQSRSYDAKKSPTALCACDVNGD
ncbi:VCBS repeat-containing protein, partial [candidate division WOR-3 bacterium]|nr:VCBS repeat-containing protein [candidate division WOR-3 bacterium]